MLLMKWHGRFIRRFLDEVSTIYEEQNILGYSIGENRQWITGREYNAAPVFYNSERGYYYKVFEFNFTDVGPNSEGKGLS